MKSRRMLHVSLPATAVNLPVAVNHPADSNLIQDPDVRSLGTLVALGNLELNTIAVL